MQHVLPCYSGRICNGLLARDFRIECASKADGVGIVDRAIPAKNIGHPGADQVFGQGRRRVDMFGGAAGR